MVSCSSCTALGDLVPDQCSGAVAFQILGALEGDRGSELAMRFNQMPCRSGNLDVLVIRDALAIGILLRPE